MVSNRFLRLGSILAGLLLIFPAAVPMARAADLLIGFIDSERIFAEYQGTKEAQAEFNADLEKWGQELEARKRELEQLEEQYKQQELILSEPMRKQKEQEILGQRSELDAFAREIWGPQGKVAERNEQLTRPIVERMNEVLTRIGEHEGFSIIFDAADGNVVYADRALDLTDRVLEALHDAEN
jgi:outer membrane protein